MFSRFRKIFAAVLLIAFITPVFAQEENDEDSDWFWNHKIEEVTFEGLKNIRRSDLTGISSAYVDEAFTEDLYGEMLDRLESMDLFEDIVPYAKHAKRNKDNILLVFQVTEKPVISSINFVGNKEIRNGELRDQIGIKTSDVYVESKVLMDERIIRDYYIKKGYSESKVSHKTEIVDGEVKITFQISEGNSTIIKKINIRGNSIVSERVLKSKIQLKEVGFLKDGAFQKSTLEADKQIIVSYYQERGYIDANIVDVLMEKAYNEEKSRNELTITFIVSEGNQYIYKGISFSGNEVFKTAKLESLMKLSSGAIYNHTKFQEGLMNIVGLYYENGYMACDVSPVPVKDIDLHEVRYNVNIRENSRSHVENIIIKGNNKTKDFVIRRELPIESGDVFSRDKIMNGLRNLYNLQYFSSIVPDTQAGSEDGLVDLVFSVEEQSTTALQFGVTFSGSQSNNAGTVSIPFSLFLKLENSNLFGEGRTISTSASLSPSEQSIDLGYSQNWIGSLPVQFSQNLSFAHSSAVGLRFDVAPDGSLDSKYNYMNYESWSTTLGSSIGKRWTPDFAILTLAGGINNALTYYKYDQAQFIPVDNGISQYADRLGLLNSVWTSFSLDGRDRNYDPSQGWFASQRFSWNGFVPRWEKEFFLREDTKLEGYLTLLDLPVTESWNLKFVLAGYSGLSGIFQVPGTPLGDSNKLYIDGMFNGRGWTNAYSYSTGKAMWSNRLELRMPVVENYLGVDGFFDAITVKDDFGSMFTNLKPEDWYFSFGPGVRFLIPQFPLHLLFAWKARYDKDAGSLKLDSNPFQFVLSFNIVNK